jgi:hypothetical protein
MPPVVKYETTSQRNRNNEISRRMRKLQPYCRVE